MSVLHRRPLLSYLLLCAVVALWIDFSRFHLGQNSDSLVPILVSLQHWTPFYWEQSRFGMLVPLLATPFEHPLVNLLVQNGITIFAGLAAIGLLARFVVRSSIWFSAACGSCAVFLVCLAEPLRFDYLIAQPYGVSFSLGLGALLVLERKLTALRCGLATILLLLAAWVNLAVGPSLLLIVMARWITQRFAWRHAPTRLVMLLAIGTLAGFAFERLAEYRDPQLMRLTSLRRWPQACETLLVNAATHGGAAYQGTIVVLIFAATGGLILIPARRRMVAWHCFAALMLSTVLLVLLAGRSRWTILNDGMPRYIYVAMLALQTGLILAVAWPLHRWLRQHNRKSFRWAAALGMLVAVVVTYGAPSLDCVRASLDKRFSATTAEILETGCTHVAGDYWRVWPAVFHANLRLHDQGAPRMVWGVAYRAEPALRAQVPVEPSSCRVVILGPDETAERLLEKHLHFGVRRLDAAFSLLHGAVE